MRCRRQLFVAAGALFVFAASTGVQAQPVSIGHSLQRDDAGYVKVDYYYPGQYRYGSRYGYRYRESYDEGNGLLDLPAAVLGGVAGLVGGIFGGIFDDTPYYERPYYVSSYYGSPYRGGGSYRRSYYSPYNGDDYYVGPHYSVRKYREADREYYERSYHRDYAYRRYDDDGWYERRRSYSYRRYERERWYEDNRYRAPRRDYDEPYYGDRYAGRSAYYGPYQDDD
jgi:hypothetical protein